MNNAQLTARSQHVNACRRSLIEHIIYCRQCNCGSTDKLWIHIDCQDGAACYGEYWQARVLHAECLRGIVTTERLAAAEKANRYE